jgi:hypothetical protein
MITSDIKQNTLCNDISKHQKFVLYGTGYMAQRLMDVLEDRNLRPVYCVVTDLNDSTHEFRGIPVYNFLNKAVEILNEDILVFVAVTEKYENEILDTLHNSNISNIKLCSEYFFKPLTWFTFDVFENTYKDKAWGWYVDRVEEWYLEQYGCQLDFVTFADNIDVMKNRIVLVVEAFSPRVVKIAEALKDVGKDVIVYLNIGMKQRPVWMKFLQALENTAIEFKFYTYIEELIFGLIQNKGGVIHIFSNMYCLYPYILVKLQDYIGNVVFENYDIANGFYTNIDEKHLQIERYCMENARGVIVRWFSMEDIFDMLDFRIKGKTFRFLDYCSGETNPVVRKGSRDESRELTICYVGGVVTEEDNSYGGFIEIAKKCEEHHCHLHVYPSSWDEVRYEKYIEESQKSEYFHFHKPIPYDELIDTISKYDYGMFPSRSDVLEKERCGVYTKYTFIYCATNKFFDYLDAGLPIIAGFPLKFSEYLEKENVLFRWNMEQYDFELLKQKREEMQKNVFHAWEKLHINNHIYELIRFYDSL